MNYRWFISKTFRHASAMRKHVHHILSAQRDLLSPHAVDAVRLSVSELSEGLRTGARKDALLQLMKNLDAAADKWLLRYPHHSWRENVEVFLVALAVAMAIRTFFLQPFKIPTGSMQPTLYGVTSSPDFSKVTSEREYNRQVEEAKNWKRSSGLERFEDWFRGISYVEIDAKRDGLVEIGSPVGLPILYFWQDVRIGGKSERIYFPPDYGNETLGKRAGIQPGHHMSVGQSLKLKVQAGDHLFVDRFTYNFRKPTRGEIVVFQTAGMDSGERDNWRIPGDQFYIKRLVALENERVSIGPDSHLIIDGKRLDASAPRFENVYRGSDAGSEYYVGHIPMGKFLNQEERTVGVGRFMVMGDNTRSSLDSRYFGDVDSDSIIGRSSFVYWPITERFGLGYR
jgi:signal peptidase I